MRQAFAKAGVDYDRTVAWIPTLDRGRFFGLMQRATAMLDTIGLLRLQHRAAGPRVRPARGGVRGRVHARPAGQRAAAPARAWTSWWPRRRPSSPTSRCAWWTTRLARAPAARDRAAPPRAVLRPVRRCARWRTRCSRPRASRSPPERGTRPVFRPCSAGSRASVPGNFAEVSRRPDAARRTLMARLDFATLTRTITADALAHPTDLGPMLAKRHSVSRGTMTKQLKRLVDSGWLRAQRRHAPALQAGRAARGHHRIRGRRPRRAHALAARRAPGAAAEPGGRPHRPARVRRAAQQRDRPRRGDARHASRCARRPPTCTS